MPAPLAGLRRASGDIWEVAWNETHGTPQLVVPLAKVEVAVEEMLTGEDTYACLVAGLRDFADAHGEFFGVSAGDLGEPDVYAVRGNRAVVFPQVTAGGLAVRGANLRAVLRADGSLGWIKAYLVREARDPEGSLLDEAAVRALAPDPSSGAVPASTRWRLSERLSPTPEIPTSTAMARPTSS